MNSPKKHMHFVSPYFINPTNPVLVNIIGAGGTGSHVLTAMGRINQSLLALDHPGLQVRIFDDDQVSKTNLGRQLFTTAEIGLNKAVALINRMNRFFGTNWQAIPKRYDEKVFATAGRYYAGLTISCVDTVAARFEIARILHQQSRLGISTVEKPTYWMDFGNSQSSGQVILSTVGRVTQPQSQLFIPVDYLPYVTEEFKDLLLAAETSNTGPSCSVAEALDRQDLFINSTLANLGASLIWNMFRSGMVDTRGFFVNLKEFKTQPLKVD